MSEDLDDFPSTEDIDDLMRVLSRSRDCLRGMKKCLREMGQETGVLFNDIRVDCQKDAIAQYESLHAKLTQVLEIVIDVVCAADGGADE